MVSKSYIQQKVESIDNSIGYICKQIGPQDSAMVVFLTKTLKGAVENAAHHTDDMLNYPECCSIIWLLAMHLQCKFESIKNEVEDTLAFSEDEKKSLMPDIDWCISRTKCIFSELPNVEDLPDFDDGIPLDLEDFSIEETHASLMQPEDSESEEALAFAHAVVGTEPDVDDAVPIEVENESVYGSEHDPERECDNEEREAINQAYDDLGVPR